MEISPRSESARWFWVALFAMVTLALLAGGYAYYRSETERIRQEKYQEIAAIGKLKAQQIQQWRRERLGDISRSSKAPFFAQGLREWLRDMNNTALQAKLHQRLVFEQKEEGYADVLLIDTEYRVLLSAEPEPHPLTTAAKKVIEQALAQRAPMLSDLYRCPRGIVHVDAVGPLLDSENRPVAVLVLRSNAESYLYPLIQSWPTPSRTAETLLVRREGEEVLFLNDLRHRPKSALSLREPLTLSELPGVQAVLGKQGIFQGKDYRGVEVLADLRPIPQSPWFMVAKVDAAEILAEVRYRGGVIVLFCGLFILLAAGVTAYGYRYRQVRLYRDLYRSERETRMAQEEFRTTLYSIGDAVITTDTEGLVRQMNPVAEQLTGWLESEAKGHPLDKVFHIVNEESRGLIENPVQRVLRQGLVIGLANHTLLIARNGAERPIADSGAPIRDESGVITGVVLVFRDQTNERAAQKALEHTASMLRSVLAASPIGIILTQDRRIHWANDAWEKIFGFDNEYEYMDQPTRIMHPSHENYEHVRKLLYDNLNPGEVSETEATLARKDGTLFDAQISVNLLDPSDSSKGTISAISDISQRRRMQEALRESEERFRNIFNFAPDPYFLNDLQGRFLDGNLAAEEMIGYKKEEVIGKTFVEAAILVPEQIPLAVELLKTSARGEPTGPNELTLVRKDGRPVEVEITTFPIQMDEKTVVLGIARDISERKRSEEELRKSEEKLKSIFRAAPVGIGVVVNRVIKEANDHFCEMTGYGREELLDANSRLVYATDEDFEFVGREKYEQIAEKGKGTVETRWRRKNGEVINVLLSSSPIDQADMSSGVTFTALDITERKRSEEAIRESEKRYRSLFENMLEGYAYCKMFFDDGHPQDFIYLDVNDAFERLTGLRNVVGRKVTEIIPGIRESNPELLEVYGRVARTGNPEKLETYVESLGIWFSISVYSTEREHFIAVFDNITERKRASEALQESEQRFRILADGAFEGVVISRGGFILDCNKVFCEKSGYTLEELVGMSIWDIVAPEFKDIARDHVLSGSEEDYESAFLHKDGHVISALVRGKTIPYGGGPARIASVRDISAAKRAEEVQRRLATAIEQSAEAVLITDTEGIIHYVNPAMERITGFSSEELLGKTPRVFKSGEHDTAFYRQLWDTIKEGNIWSGRFVNKRKDGSLFHEEATISPVRSASGKITNFVAVKRDVTEHLQLSSQLLQAQKMEAIGTLAGGVAHDFNNLLQVVLGYSELILSDEGFDGRHRDDLKKIHQAAGDGADLVKRLLTFSRKAEANPKPLNLNMQINKAKKMLSRTLPKMIEIQLILADDLATIHADPIQMEQILMNLAVNSRDAMPDGGRLVIETRNVHLDEDYSHVHLGAKPGQYVLVTVSDTGHGIDKVTLEHVFEPFYTTKGPGEGTGLGLAMVYGIVKQHNGRIMCYSEPGKGTDFKLYFPAVVNEIEAQEEPSRSMPPGGTETILLVDDENLLLELGQRILTKAGYTVLTAGNGKEALEFYRKEGNRIALVVLDLMMPEMGGKRCLEELLKMNPEARVLIASGYSLNGSTKAALKVAAKGFVAKPYDVRQLLETLRDVLDSSPGDEK